MTIDHHQVIDGRFKCRNLRLVIRSVEIREFVIARTDVEFARRRRCEHGGGRGRWRGQNREHDAVIARGSQEGPALRELPANGKRIGSRNEGFGSNLVDGHG